MLLFPFVSAAILARAWSWNLLPALLGALAVFLIREPLLVWMRQRYLWKDQRPETAAAVRSFWIFAGVLAAAAFWLAAIVPILWLAALGSIAAALTALHLYGALRNLQRSPALQVIGALGLSGSAFLPWLAVGRNPEPTLWLLIGAHVLHGCGSVLVVHARLEAVRGLKAGSPGQGRATTAVLWLVLHGLACVGLLLTARSLLAASLALPLVVHAADLLRLGNATFLRVPLRRVGLRELALSSVFSALVVASLL
jgi:hypothetical protein